MVYVTSKQRSRSFILVPIDSSADYQRELQKIQTSGEELSSLTGVKRGRLEACGK